MTVDSQPHIVFVDDEPSILRALKRACHSCHWRISCVLSGKDALALLEQGSADIVVSDMRMPHMDGAQLLQTISQRWPRVMRILLSGFADQEATVRAINQGKIFNYMYKPWDNQQLIATLNLALEAKAHADERRRLQKLTESQNQQLLTLNDSLEHKVKERTIEIEQAFLLLKRTNKNLKKNYKTTNRLLAQVVEMRETQGAGHGRRVAELSLAMARELGLNNDLVEQIEVAAMLHDIGSLALPDRVLNTVRQKLSPLDLHRYQQHSLLGEAILMEADNLQPAALLIRQHHEHIDGSGYPDALKGDDISIGARIIGLVSEYDDAACGKITGHGAKADALQLVQAGAGSAFDANYCELLITLVNNEQLNSKIAQQVITPDKLAPGMKLAEDMTTDSGILLLAKGHVLTTQVIAKIHKFEVDADHHLNICVQLDPNHTSEASE